MDEQNQDWVDYDVYKIEIKEEKPDLDLITQDRVTTNELKEENQEFYVSQVKEETRHLDSVEQISIKEEQQEAENRSTATAGSEQQVRYRWRTLPVKQIGEEHTQVSAV
ncbi:uncharacterized protein LOC114851255 isoform X6 [Betta splendens]|uniref:Uncharacterized protein LOC114851255 isoform X6 n=1 Tax=Betta splendens TaxID=158456 RepID=A0A9W2Y923_BETSP|nr:uncharacterized protein LOC114851255 isoform X6 [Betta splendens]